MSSKTEGKPKLKKECISLQTIRHTFVKLRSSCVKLTNRSWQCGKFRETILTMMKTGRHSRTKNSPRGLYDKNSCAAFFLLFRVTFLIVIYFLAF